MFFVCFVYTAVQSCCYAYCMISIPHTKTELPFAADRNDYQQCLYPECLTSPEEKLDSHSNWSRISCGSEQRVRLQPTSFLLNSLQHKDTDD